MYKPLLAKTYVLTWQKVSCDEGLLQRALLPFQNSGQEEGQLGVPKLMAAHPHSIRICPACGHSTCTQIAAPV